MFQNLKTRVKTGLAAAARLALKNAIESQDVEAQICSSRTNRKINFWMLQD